MTDSLWMKINISRCFWSITTVKWPQMEPISTRTDVKLFLFYSSYHSKFSFLRWNVTWHVTADVKLFCILQPQEQQDLGFFFWRCVKIIIICQFAVTIISNWVCIFISDLAKFLWNGLKCCVFRSFSPNFGLF